MLAVWAVRPLFFGHVESGVMAAQPVTEPSDTLAKAIDDAVRPVLAAEGYDLVLVEYIARSRILRLYVDQEVGVGIDDCKEISYLVSDILDAQGLSERIEGSFNLEVSSPGLDRPLVRPKDFCRFVGSEIRVSTREALDGRRRFTGRLLEADSEPGGGIRVDVDGKKHPILYEAIHRARLVPDL